MEGNQLSLSSGWIILQYPVYQYLVTFGHKDSKIKPFFVKSPKWARGCFRRSDLWHLCAAMGWADAETNTGLPRRRKQTEIQSVNPVPLNQADYFSQYWPADIFSRSITGIFINTLCNQSHYTHHDDWFPTIWLDDLLIPLLHTI